MSRTLLAFPVPPGKSDDTAKLIAEEFRSRPREYEASRRHAGITLERAYLQKTPMGDYVVAYSESSLEFSEYARLMAQSDLEIDRFFVRSVKELRGVDMREALQGPPPETIAAWFDPRVTSRGRGLGFCAPLIPDAVETARSILARKYASKEFAESRRALRQNAEVAGLLITPQGPVGLAYLEGADPAAANRRFAASTDPYDLGFKEELKKIFPPIIDFSKPVEGVEEIFDSTQVAEL
jgi:hypothetical protein